MNQKVVVLVLLAALTLALAGIVQYFNAKATAHYREVTKSPGYQAALVSSIDIAPRKAPMRLDVTRPPLARAPARVLHDVPPLALARGYVETNPSRYASHIEAASRRTKVPAALIRAVISAESAFNPYALSATGAVGLMQLMPDTAERYGVINRLDPSQNILGGALYLSDLMRLFKNNMSLTLAAYNAGEGAVMKHGRRIPPYPETVAYVPKVMGYYKRYRLA